MKNYSPQEINELSAAIDNLDRVEMARLWRFAESGHPYFRSDLPLYEKFKQRFHELGGFSPEISKLIEWDK